MIIERCRELALRAPAAVPEMGGFALALINI